MSILVNKVDCYNPFSNVSTKRCAPIESTFCPSRSWSSQRRRQRRRRLVLYKEKVNYSVSVNKTFSSLVSHYTLVCLCSLVLSLLSLSLSLFLEKTPLNVFGTIEEGKLMMKKSFCWSSCWMQKIGWKHLEWKYYYSFSWCISVSLATCQSENATNNCFIVDYQIWYEDTGTHEVTIQVTWRPVYLSMRFCKPNKWFRTSGNWWVN